MNDLTVLIDEAGRLHFVYDDALAGLLSLGKSETVRVSHVEPAPGGWVASMAPVGGADLGPYRLRSEALAAERRWLREHLEL